MDLADAAQPSEGDGQIVAAVLVALYRQEGELHVVLTKRRGDLRRHAGEISFPGGRRDIDDTDLSQTALREAEEEIGLGRDQVTLLGALERTSTFVTNYAIHPFVGLIPASGPWQMSAREVESVLEPTLSQLRAAKTRTQLQRRGITFQTDAYILGEHLIWGATARILENLLGRVGPVLDHPVS
ncbi:MAG TPA: CoA pyrophosphatase [Solirubrobacteraceae bacterium]